MIDPAHRAYFMRSPAHGLPFAWRWPNFSYQELESKDGSGLLIVPAQLDLLQALRNEIQRPIRVHSHYRSFAHNMNVGGSKNSLHLSGCATDISVGGFTPAILARYATQAGFTGIGRYRTFLHVDIGPKREWGE